MSVTETVTPSVRGRQKVVVAVLLTTASTATGALVGFGLGGLWTAAQLPAASPLLITAVGAAAVVADAVRVRPVAVGKQVPVEWAAIFGPRLVAVLYGGRLGVGPLTILPSWLWWAAVLIGAMSGPLASTLVGATFGAVRAVAMVGVAEYARHAMAARMIRVRAGEPAAALLSAAASLVLVALAWR